MTVHDMVAEMVRWVRLGCDVRAWCFPAAGEVGFARGVRVTEQVGMDLDRLLSGLGELTESDAREWFGVSVEVLRAWLARPETRDALPGMVIRGKRMVSTLYVVVVVDEGVVRTAVYREEALAQAVCSRAADVFGVQNVSMHAQPVQESAVLFWEE